MPYIKIHQQNRLLSLEYEQGESLLHFLQKQGMDISSLVVVMEAVVNVK